MRAADPDEGRHSMTTNTPKNAHGSSAEGRDAKDQAKDKAQQAAGEAQGQAKAVAHDAKDKAQDLAATAKHEAGQVKDEAADQVQSLVGSAQEQVGAQVQTQQERLAGQVRSYTDDLHRVVSGEQPQTDLVRQGVASVADRAEALTQRLETASPQDLLQDVRGFASGRGARRRDPAPPGLAGPGLLERFALPGRWPRHGRRRAPPRGRRRGHPVRHAGAGPAGPDRRAAVRPDPARG